MRLRKYASCCFCTFISFLKKILVQAAYPGSYFPYKWVIQVYWKKITVVNRLKCFKTGIKVPKMTGNGIKICQKAIFFTHFRLRRNFKATIVTAAVCLPSKTLSISLKMEKQKSLAELILSGSQHLRGICLTVQETIEL